jgi:hypothetical protein
MADQLAYFLGNQGGSNAMFVPVLVIQPLCLNKADFNL